MLDWSNEDLVNSVLTDLTDYAKEVKASYIKIDPQIVPLAKQIIDLPNLCVISDGSVNFLKIRLALLEPANPIQEHFLDRFIPFRRAALGGHETKNALQYSAFGAKGVRVAEGNSADLEKLYEMYLETSIRDGFIIRPKLIIWMCGAGSFKRAVRHH